MDLFRRRNRTSQTEPGYHPPARTDAKAARTLLIVVAIALIVGVVYIALSWDTSPKEPAQPPTSGQTVPSGAQ